MTKKIQYTGIQIRVKKFLLTQNVCSVLTFFHVRGHLLCHPAMSKTTALSVTHTAQERKENGEKALEASNNNIILLVVLQLPCAQAL